MKNLALLFSLLILSACTNKEELKKEIKEELKNEIMNNASETAVKKGDGTYFYDEPVGIAGETFKINHSTLKCPAIKGGVQRDYRFTAKSARGRNLFCHICMDDHLIDVYNSQWSNYTE
ncbi:MAG: hypothetical protein MJY81_05975 [Bacteroidaceae bacterium]|nr:hypothetical protein [Bacteroidaceae bacterium]